MFEMLRAEDVVGKGRFIDKLELVRQFLLPSCFREVRLTSQHDLSIFLETQLEASSGGKVPGVYCIYSRENALALYVGQSKRLSVRIKDQLIGKGADLDKPHFTRLFYGVIKRERGIKEKLYKGLPDAQKHELIKFYQKTIFRPSNMLRACPTETHIQAVVLEHTLISYFKAVNQCKYNFQV